MVWCGVVFCGVVAVVWCFAVWCGVKDAIASDCLDRPPLRAHSQHGDRCARLHNVCSIVGVVRHLTLYGWGWLVESTTGTRQ